MTGAWPKGSTDYTCPVCGAGPKSRCRTSSGNRATGPHVARVVPRFRCPRCDHVTELATNVTQGYCPVCDDWTGDGAHGHGQPTLLEL